LILLEATPLNVMLLNMILVDAILLKEILLNETLLEGMPQKMMLLNVMLLKVTLLNMTLLDMMLLAQATQVSHRTLPIHYKLAPQVMHLTSAHSGETSHIVYSGETPRAAHSGSLPLAAGCTPTHSSHLDGPSSDSGELNPFDNDAQAAAPSEDNDEDGKHVAFPISTFPHH
jgi:hypothetical protein